MYLVRVLLYTLLICLIGREAISGEALLLSLEINHSVCSEILMGTLTPDGLIFALKDLKKCDLHIPASEQTINLKQLPTLTYKVDREQLKVSMDVPTEWLKTHTYQGTLSPETTNTPPSLYSMAINYDVSGHTFAQQNFVAGLPEFILFTPQGCGKASFLARSKGDEKALRLETYWIKENSEKMEQLRFGDAISTAPAWGGSARFSGFQWSTNFATRPNFISFPQVAILGQAAMPTSIDILSNNTRLYQQQVKAGPYEIIDLPVVTGGGALNVQMVDLLGNQQTLTVPYYVSSDLLKPGLSSFSYEIGLLRESFGIKSNDYSSPALVLTHRQGISNNYTVGWHGEASRRHLLGSIDQTFLIGQLGTVSLSTAAQYSKQKPQGLLSVSAEHQANNSINFGGRLTYATVKFRDISMITSGSYPKMALQSFITGSYENWGSLTLSLTSARNRNRRPFQLFTTNYQKPLSNNFYLSISMGHQFKDKKETSIFASLTYCFGEGRTGSISQSKTTDYSRTSVSFQQNTLGELGTGYRVRASHESDDNLEYEAELSNSHSYGSIQARSLRNENSSYHQLNMSGALLYIDQSLFVTRKIYNSVGLVKVPSCENVEVYLNNSPIGKTNRFGEVLAPALLNFTETSIRVNEQGIPINAQLETEKQSFFIPSQGAYSINFKTHAGESKSFKVLFENNHPLKPGLIIKWSDGESTVVGYNSEIYRSLPTFSQQLTGILHTEDNICHIKLDYSEIGQRHVNDYPILVCTSSFPKSNSGK